MCQARASVSIRWLSQASLVHRKRVRDCVRMQALVESVLTQDLVHDGTDQLSQLLLRQRLLWHQSRFDYCRAGASVTQDDADAAVDARDPGADAPPSLASPLAAGAADGGAVAGEGLTSVSRCCCRFSRCFCCDTEA